MLGLAEKAAMIVYLLGLVCLVWQKKTAITVHLLGLVHCSHLDWQKKLPWLCTCLVWYAWFGRKSCHDCALAWFGMLGLAEKTAITALAWFGTLELAEKLP
jgi:hypothetical protein